MPANAWGLVIKPRRITVHAGSGVEHGASFIAEGAWAGPFTAKGALTSRFRCGSGAVVDGKRIVLFGPSHPVEHIYCFVGRGYLTASNSIHLAIALAKDAMPPDLKVARSRVATIVAGSHHYDRVLYQTKAGTMLRLAFGTWTIDRRRLSISETGPALSARDDFTDFAGYRRLLLETLGSLVENARAPERRVPYGDILATCSSGYDSPACAALARELGCREAITLRTGRGGREDSGKRVAESLGMTCHEAERLGEGLEQRIEERRDHFLDVQHLPPGHDAFFGSINACADLWFEAFASLLPGRILFTGFHGGKIWGEGCTSGPEIKRADSSGSGLDEFRKRLGFVHVPVPFIGAANHARFAELFTSEEMRPYRIPGGYDRPVARRLAEEAGVPRDWFGQKKSAGSVMTVNDLERRHAAFAALVETYRTAIPPRDKTRKAGRRES